MIESHDHPQLANLMKSSETISPIRSMESTDKLNNLVRGISGPRQDNTGRIQIKPA